MAKRVEVNGDSDSDLVDKISVAVSEGDLLIALRFENKRDAFEFVMLPAEKDREDVNYPFMNGIGSVTRAEIVRREVREVTKARDVSIEYPFSESKTDVYVRIRNEEGKSF